MVAKTSKVLGTRLALTSRLNLIKIAMRIFLICIITANLAPINFKMTISYHNSILHKIRPILNKSLLEYCTNFLPIELIQTPIQKWTLN